MVETMQLEKLVVRVVGLIPVLKSAKTRYKPSVTALTLGRSKSRKRVVATPRNVADRHSKGQVEAHFDPIYPFF